MPKKTKYGNLLQFASEDTQKATFKGTIYRKEVAKFGQWVNPDYPWFSDDPNMTLDEAWAETIVKNFNEDALGSPVPVPLNHTDDVRVNTGVVKSLEIVPGDGLYAELEIRDEDTIAKLDKGLIFDVSISFMWDFIRQDNGKHYGATLLHVALVNTPYLIGMNSFEKVGEALSRLSKNLLKPLGLAHTASEGAIMLSRTKAKELSNMDLSTIKNDKDFDVTVKYKDGEEEKEVVVKAGEEVEVPTEVAEEVTTQIADATKPEEDEEVTPPTEDNEDPENPDENNEENEDPETPEEDEENPDEEEDEDKKKDKELARVKLENATLSIEKRYSELLSAGKVIPAQKAKLESLAKLGQGVTLSLDSGKKVDLATIVFDILEAGAVKFSTDESGSSEENPNPNPDGGEDNEDNDEKKPSEALSEAELAGFKAVGADPSKMDELAEKDPVFREALKTLSSKYEKRSTK